jgi:hypothetical protein
LVNQLFLKKGEVGDFILVNYSASGERVMSSQVVHSVGSPSLVEVVFFPGRDGSRLNRGGNS